MAAIVPSWQQLPPQHAAIQQPLLSDAGDWGRPLIVDSSAILQVGLVNEFYVTFLYITFVLYVAECNFSSRHTHEMFCQNRT